MSKPLAQQCLELLSRFSPRTQYRIGDLMTWLLRVIPNQISSQAKQNIELCFANRNASERRHIYREALRHACYTMTELGSVWCGPTDQVLERINERDICPEFEQSARSKIILAPHLGSWETLALWLGKHYSAIMLYTPQKDVRLDDFMKQARSRTGGCLVPTTRQGLKQLLVGLRKGETLMILPDQKPHGSKIRVPSKFFGFNAPTTSLVHSLCSKVDCDVFVATVYRRSPADEFGLRIEPLEYERLVDNDIDSTQYMNDCIEQLVLKHVEQYQWGYRRFVSSVYASAK